MQTSKKRFVSFWIVNALCKGVLSLASNVWLVDLGCKWLLRVLKWSSSFLGLVQTYILACYWVVIDGITTRVNLVMLSILENIVYVSDMNYFLVLEYK